MIKDDLFCNTRLSTMHRYTTARALLQMALAAWPAVSMLALVGMPTQVQAQAVAAQQIDFDIAPGPLNQALILFGQASRTTIVADPALTDRQQTRGLHGRHTLEEGLSQLLEGTSLQAVPNAPGSGFRLRRIPQMTTTTEARAHTTLPDIIVTGEKVSRSIFDTSSSVAIYDAATLAGLPNATSVSDVLKRTPNVVDLGIGNNLPTIRGVDGSGPLQGAAAFLAGTRPRLNMSVDGRSSTYNEFAFGTQSLWDVEQVEVFRGPQSHIQGRNAIAGAIVMSTKNPSWAWESAVRGMKGNQHSWQTAAMLSGPIVDDTLAFRLSVDRQERKSFVDLISYDPVGDPRRIETTTTRAKLLFEPSGLPGLSSMLTLNHIDSRTPQGEATNPPPGYVSARFDPRRPVFTTKSTSGIWDLGWNASDTIRLENKLVYTDFSNERLMVDTLPHARIDGHEFQLEPLLRFDLPGGDIRGLAGIRYFRGTQDEYVNLFNGSSFRDETETRAIFGEATFALTSQLDLTLATRFEQEHHKRRGGSSAVRIDLDKTYSALLPKFDLAWKPDHDLTLGAMITRGYNAGGAGITFGAPIVSYTFDPEYVWNYELYSRQHFLDDTLELTANLFLNEYTDMQLPYYLGPNSSVIRNADKARTYGAELGVRWMPVPELEAFGTLGLLRTKITQFADSGIEGNRLARAPDYSFSAGLKYRFGGGFEINSDVQFNDSYYSQYDNDALGRIASHWTANLQLAYAFKGGRVALFAQNLFDADRPTFITNNDPTTPFVQRPRLVGITAEFSF